jgi:tetratricopeptide (TPR) repeat protein
MGTSRFDIGEGFGEYEYNFFTINGKEDFSALIDYYRSLLKRFNYFYENYRTVKDNKDLSFVVKSAMMDHKANISLTFLEEKHLENDLKTRRIVINEEVSEGIYNTSFFNFYYLIPPANDSRNYYEKGLVYLQKDCLAAAIHCLTISIKLNPLDAAPYGLRGLAYSGRGDYDLSIDDCTQAIKLSPDNAEYLMLRGHAYAGKDDYTAAINDLSRVIEINPGYALAYTTRGDLYQKTDDYDNARADYTKALELNPDNETVQKTLKGLDDKKE